MARRSSAPKKEHVSQFFYFLFSANVLMYMEAGAVPASLLPLAASFSMSLSEQGLLGGIVFLSIAFAGPFAGYFLRHYEHRYVLGFSFAVFNLLTFCWALTPTDWEMSSTLFILLRFLMGLCQCVCCVFFPLWTNDFAPRRNTASWMSMLQASVPFGVMAGYIVASIILRFSNDKDECLLGLYCWRLPLLLEGVALVPFSFIMFFIPSKLVTVRMGLKPVDVQAATGELDHTSHGISYGSTDVLSGGSHHTAVAMTPERADSRARWFSEDGSTNGFEMGGGISASITPLRLKRRERWYEDQRKSYRRLRQSSMAASLYDSMSARDVLRQSHSSLAILDSKDDHLLGMISSGGLRWVDSDREDDEDADDNDEEDNARCESNSERRNKYLKQLDKWEQKLKTFFGNDSSSPLEDAETLGDVNGAAAPGSKNSMYRSWSMPVEPSDRSVGTGAAADSDALLMRSPGSSRSNSFDSEPGSIEEDYTTDEDGNQIVDMSSASLCLALFRLSKMPVYRSVVLSMSALYFVVTGVQFWGTSYMIIALKTPVLMVQCFFIFVAATAPTSGVMFGGWYLDQKGGYKGVKQRYIALKICIVFGSLGLFWAILTIFTTNFYLVVAYIWLVLFCGGATLPGCSGIAVSVVPRAYRAYSSSISLIVFNLFGYFLSVSLSGFLMQIASSLYPSCDEVCSRTFGFRVVLLWSFWSILFLIHALYAAKKAYEKKKNEQLISTIDNPRRYQTLYEA